MSKGLVTEKFAIFNSVLTIINIYFYAMDNDMHHQIFLRNMVFVADKAYG